MKRTYSVIGAVVSGLVPTLAMADVTVDYSGAVTSVTAQITSALTAGLPVWGTILGLLVGIALFKRFVKGR